jgi:hypothetical protein
MKLVAIFFYRIFSLATYFIILYRERSNVSELQVDATGQLPQEVALFGGIAQSLPLESLYD